ncbi:MAG: DUF86 domain-containing protein [Ideonella sp.]|jgi:hypothetical protein|nr:DUF86 domain-containing protein [Ideonella sp.]MBP8100349.1 DUF86 domain-containing protein [Burkholderiaceae bacterium]
MDTRSTRGGAQLAAGEKGEHARLVTLKCEDAGTGMVGLLEWPEIPWCELAGFRNVIMRGYLRVDLGAVWLVVEQDLPALTEAVSRMSTRLGRHG